MIAEPYICTACPKAGRINWFYPAYATTEKVQDKGWQPYADFEREKLRELGHGCIAVDGQGSTRVSAFFLGKLGSMPLVQYSSFDYLNDSESSRLLKRAEFLKAVCEKEGVEWLPQEPRWSDVKVKDNRLTANLYNPPRYLYECKHGTPHTYLCEKCVAEKKGEEESDRDYYTKKEIDERVEAVLEFLNDNMAFSKNRRTRIENLRRRFLQ